MKISVVVPVYNAEKYLEKCISSIKEQTYENWELILVNDGSLDKSSVIADKAAKSDSRIKVIHQKNAGAGKARNRGMEVATGDFVVFLDSDDYVDKDYFKYLVPKAENSDVVFIDVLQISPDGKLLKEEKMSKYKSWEKDQIVRSQMTGKIPWGGVRKAVRLTILRNNSINYTLHSVGEEALYSFRILCAAERVTFLDEKPVYYYVNHKNSQSKKSMADPWGEVVDTIYNYLKKNSLYEKYADTLNAFNVTATVVSLDKIARLYKGIERKKYSEQRICQFLDLYDKEKQLDKSSMSYKARVFVPFILRGFYQPVIVCSRLRSFVT